MDGARWTDIKARLKTIAYHKSAMECGHWEFKKAKYDKLVQEESTLRAELKELKGQSSGHGEEGEQDVRPRRKIHRQAH
jgi:hypothetical protein